MSYLLGRPWQFDRKTIQDGEHNTYTFEKDGFKHVLISERERLKPPNSVSNFAIQKAKNPKEKAKSSPIFLPQANFEYEFRESKSIVFLVANEEGETKTIPPAIQPLLDSYKEPIAEELLKGLPPLQDIQHDRSRSRAHLTAFATL